MSRQPGLAPRADPAGTPSPLHWPARRISILLTVVALVLWSYSIAQARFEIGFYGLISGFPVTFFVSLGILTIASAVLWVSGENNWGLLFLQLGFLVVSIWLAPVMVGGAQPFLSSPFSDLGYIEYIVRTGSFDQAVMWQHNWPIAWTFWAMVIQVPSSDVDGLAGLIPWIPFLWQCVLFLPMFVFFRNTIGKVNPNYCWGALWMFYLWFWFESQNTGAQAFGVFFVFSVLAVLTMTPYWQQRSGTFGHRFSAIILFAVSAAAHLLGSLVTLAITGALYLSRRVKSSNLVILAAIFVAAWSIYGAVVYFEGHLPAFVRHAFRLDVATESGILNPLAGSESHAAVARVRVMFSGLFVAITILGGLLAWRLKRITSSDITAVAIAMGCGIAALGIGAGYSHELYQRLFIFLLPVMAYFGVKLLHLRTTAVVLCLLLLVALPLAFISKYGNQKMDYLSPSHLSGVDFFHEKTSDGYVVGGLPLGRVRNSDRYRSSYSFGDLEWQDSELVPFGSRAIPRYVCISNHDRATYEFYYDMAQIVDDAESSLATSTNCSLVYANGDLSLYVIGAQNK